MEIDEDSLLHTHPPADPRPPSPCFSGQRQLMDAEADASSSRRAGSVSSHIKQLQDLLSAQPAFVEDASPDAPPVASSSQNPSASVPMLPVRKRQLEIQLGGELLQRQAASMKAHDSARSAMSLTQDRYGVASSSLAKFVGSSPSQPGSNLPKQFVSILQEQGCVAPVRDAWLQVSEAETSALLRDVRDIVPTDPWDQTRMLTVRQREVLGLVFRAVVGSQEPLVLSPASTCRCILALVKAGHAKVSDLSAAIAEEADKVAARPRAPAVDPQGPPGSRAKSPLVFSLPLHLLPSHDARSSPYPSSLPSSRSLNSRNTETPRSVTAWGTPLGTPRGANQPNKISHVRKNQLELLLQDAPQRQQSEMEFQRRQEQRRPLQESQLQVASALGVIRPHVAPAHHAVSRRRPAESPPPPAASPMGLFALQPQIASAAVEAEGGDGGGLEELLSTGSGGPPPSYAQASPPYSAVDTAPVGIAELLPSLGLRDYSDLLLQSGYEYSSDLVGVTKDELLAMGILPGHAQRLINGVSQRHPKVVSPLPAS